MKNINDTKLTSAQCKVTHKSLETQTFQKINAAIKEKYTSLGLKLIDFVKNSSGIELHAITRKKTSCCPLCGKPSNSIHDYRLRKLQSLEFMNNRTTIIISLRRMNCTNKSCSKKTFMEPIEIASPYARTTKSVALRIREESLRQPSRLACETLARQHIKVSSSTCLRKAHVYGKENPTDIACSGYIAIDDLAYRKGHTYMSAIVDHYTRQVLAMFDTRYGSEIGEWLEKRPYIKLVSRDGCWKYASIIKEALPNAQQCSDHFHLVKGLGDNMADVIRKMIYKPKSNRLYPYPSQEEAKQYIMEDLYDMGVEKHRKKVRNFIHIKRMYEEGNTIKEISEKMNIRPHQVYMFLNTQMKKIITKDQMEILRNVSELSQIISSGYITPVTIAKKMEERLSRKLICRATRKLRAKYTMLRAKIRIQNEIIQKGKEKKLNTQTIKSYIMTGKTNSKKLILLKETNPNVDNIIKACIAFKNMLACKEDAPDVETWLQMVKRCRCPKLAKYAETVKRDMNAIKNTYLTSYSNGIMEGTVNKIKAIKRTMYNRAGIELLRAKVIYGSHPLN